jgi:metal transporter CNNM
LAPAPKARVQKGQIVGIAENPLPDDHLIDILEDRPQITKRITNGENRSRSKSPANAAFGTSPKTTFIRRSSAGADGNIISVRGNANDMREHLKHLGPSNLASRPKTTRYNTVKIKQAQGSNRTDSRTDSNLHRDSIIEQPYEDTPTSPAPRGGAGEGILNSAGKEASDGVQALQQGYGTLDHSFSYTSNRHSQTDQQENGPAKSAKETSKASGGHSPSPVRKLARINSSQSSDTIASLNSHENSPTGRKRGVARSGSITENVIEVGGVRKVVLETNTSSSDDKDDRARTMNRRNYENNPLKMDAPPGYDEQTETSSAPKGEEVKKKRRRVRKKKGSKASEETALLGESSNR